MQSMKEQMKIKEFVEVQKSADSIWIMGEKP